MKKTILATMLLTIGIIHSSFSADPGERKRMDKTNPSAIKTLTVNADVTIVLTEGNNQQVNMIGDETFMKLVSFKQEGNKLTVAASKRRDYKSKGIIYVPAGSIETIRINSDAFVRSADILHTPHIRIAVNGVCKVHLYTMGKVDVDENHFYEVDYKSRNLLPPGYIAINGK